MTDAFSKCHPVINFLFFGLVIGFSMFVMNPAILVISAFSAFLYLFYLDRKSLISVSKFMIPAMISAIIINPAFSHEGVTILCYLPTGNPLTLESLIYGGFSALMIGAVIMWFRCYTAVVTSDKFVYLFGKFVPSLSLVISMTLRFVPKFRTQFEAVRDAQYLIGNDIFNGNLFSRLKNTVKIFSIMVTWSLENAIETADSMKSRGYGLKGRTSFSIYRFDSRDKKIFLLLIFSGVYIFCGLLANGFKWRFFPSFKFAADSFAISFYIIFATLCNVPLIIDRREDRVWKSLR